jgi:hypothetical protein
MTMHRRIIEVLKGDPREQEVLFPVHEELLAPVRPGLPHSDFWESIYSFALGDRADLMRTLEHDPGGCLLVSQWQDSWYVRAEEAQGSRVCERIAPAEEAVQLARAIRNKRACEKALAEALAGTGVSMSR